MSTAQVAQVGTGVVLAGIGVLFARSHLVWRRDTQTTQARPTQAATEPAQPRRRRASASAELTRSTPTATSAPVSAPVPHTVNVYIGHVDQLNAHGGQGIHYGRGSSPAEVAAHAASVVSVRPAKPAKTLEGPR